LELEAKLKTDQEEVETLKLKYAEVAAKFQAEIDKEIALFAESTQQQLRELSAIEEKNNSLQAEVEQLQASLDDIARDSPSVSASQESAAKKGGTLGRMAGLLKEKSLKVRFETEAAEKIEADRKLKESNRKHEAQTRSVSLASLPPFRDNSNEAIFWKKKKRRERLISSPF